MTSSHSEGRFTEAYFDGGDGNLYKEAWPGAVGPDGQLNEINYLNALRTNAGADADASALFTFSQAINAANDDYELAKVVKKWTSVKRWAAQFAVDRAIEHWDGPVNYRKHGGESAGRNCEQCEIAAPCFSEEIVGACTDGVIEVTGAFAGCSLAAACAACYPESSCGTSGVAPALDCVGAGAIECSQCSCLLTSDCSAEANQFCTANLFAGKNCAQYAGCSPGGRERRSDRGSYWNHNFFLYEEDRKNVSKREFDLVPWDVDGKDASCTVHEPCQTPASQQRERHTHRERERDRRETRERRERVR